MKERKDKTVKHKKTKMHNAANLWLKSLDSLLVNIHPLWHFDRSVYKQAGTDTWGIASLKTKDHRRSETTEQVK